MLINRFKNQLFHDVGVCSGGFGSAGRMKKSTLFGPGDWKCKQEEEEDEGGWRRRKEEELIF